MHSTTLKFTRLTALFSFLGSAAIGCVISAGGGGKSFGDGEECPEANSYYDAGECFCDSGYDWCKPNDNNDLTCCVSQTTNGNDDTSNNTNNNTNNNTDGQTDGQTDGTTTDEPTGGTTVEEPTTSNSGTTGEPLECVVGITPPASCDENTENFLCLEAAFAECGPQGSQFYVCMGGTWVEDPTGPDANCKADGFDFGYGCEDQDMMVQFVCGVGPGTACDASGPTCNGETNLEECYYGKLSVTNCEAFCMEEGDGMMTYDYGYCGEQMGATSCICCDEGDEGCPINEGTTGDTGDTGGTTGDTGTGTSG